MRSSFIHAPGPAVVLVWLLTVTAVIPGRAGIDYPGPSPGSVALSVRGDRIQLRNGAVEATWTIQGRRLRPGVFRDRQSGATLARTGELFVVRLSDGREWPASAFAWEGGVTRERLTGRPGAAREAERFAGWRVEVPLRSPDGTLALRWRVVAHDGDSYVRQELDLQAVTDAPVPLQEVVWLNERWAEARAMGRVEGSPLVAGGCFLAVEDPMAANQADGAGAAGAGGDRAQCRWRCGAAVRPGERVACSFVLGVTPAGQLRRGFLYYLERERAHPYRPFLHYNSWYDIAWQPFALNQTNCLDAIAAFGRDFVRCQGAVLDAVVFDDGWDDPRSLWQFHAGFPRGFTPLAEAARREGTRLGVWLSPFGGYGEPRAQRLAFGAAQGYETNATGFSLDGPRYYAAFKQACVGMIRNYGVNHFKFDGIAAGMYANGAAAYFRDTEAMRRLMRELRAEDPELYINLTTGSWPSPFWLRYADSVWRQGGDMGQAGPGTPQQRWLTYRDQETYRNIVQKGPLYPLNALMTQGVAYSRQGSAGDPTFNSAGFRDDVWAFFGGGTSLQELYIQPGRLTTADWAVLAEAARWSRTNAAVLVDTHWIGGDPGALAVYGYASWTSRKGLVMLRNPAERTQNFAFEPGAAFELPPRAPAIYRLRAVGREPSSPLPATVRRGATAGITLQPFEVLVFEALPAR